MAIGAGGIVTADEYGRDSEKVIRRGRRVTTSTASTGGIVGVLRLDDIPIRGGYLYKICTGTLALQSSVANDRIRAMILYTTDGSTPTTSSTELPGSRAQVVVPVANQGIGPTIVAPYAPGSDETLSVLLCVQRGAGTGNCTIFADTTVTIDLWVEQAGEDPGDTGVDI